MKSLDLHQYLLCALVILLSAYFLRTVALSQTSFDYDEGLTLRTVRISLYRDGLFEAVKERKLHMPLYFASLLWYPEPPSEFSIRYPSVLWSMVLIAVTMRIMTHIYHAPRFALLAGFMLAIHLFTIEQARTARMYQMSNALVAISSYLFLRYITRPQGRVSAWYGAHLVSMVAYLTHVATIVLFIGQAVTWFRILLQRRVTISRLIYWLTLQCILMIPAILWITNVFEVNERRLLWVPPSTAENVVNTLESLIFGDRLSSPELSVLLLFVGLIPGIAYGVFFRRIEQSQYWFGLTVIPFTGLLIVSQIKSIFVDRYLGIAVVAYILVLVLGYKSLWDYCLPRFRRVAIAGVGGLITLHLVVMALLMYTDYQNEYFSSNFVKQATAYIEEHGQRGDAVLYAGQPYHVDYFFDGAKFKIILNSFKYRAEYQSQQYFPDDRVWLIVDNRFWDDTDIVLREPVYQYRNTRVYLIEFEDT